MQNIGADNAGDAFYRYKMPKLVAKVEGRGNGIKTNIVNNVDIARALDRPPTYTLKHFGCELGAQTNFDKRTGTSIVNGAHDAKKLSEVLETFIKKYVQCYNCGNPETVVKIRKECIHLKCKACGHTSDVDMREKLTTFMIKNPPENKLSKSEAKVKRDEKERMKAAEKEARRAEKADAKEKKRKDRRESKNIDNKSAKENDSAEDNSNDDADDADDGTEWKTDISADAVAKRKQEQLTSAAASLVQPTGTEAPPAGPETPDKSERGSKRSDSSASDADAVAVDNAATGNDAAADVQDESDNESELAPDELVRRRLDKNVTPLAFADELLGLDVPGGLVGKMKAFYGAVLEECEGRVLECMKRRDKYILALRRDEKQQASQLIALEHYLTQVRPERMNEMPFILKWLYEEDLIDEQIIIAWGSVPAVARKHGVDKASAAKIREASQAVLAWLEQSDSEDDEE